MPATELDPRTALVVIDLQKGIAGQPQFNEAVANSAKLIAAFRKKQLPVVLVNVAGSPDMLDLPRNRAERKFAFSPSPEFGELLPGLNAQPSDLRITKRQPNAFYGTELDLQLRRRQVTGIVLTGVATSSGVEATARAAHERTYNVTFASDALADFDAEAHDFMLRKIFPRIGEVDTTAKLLSLLGVG